MIVEVVDALSDPEGDSTLLTPEEERAAEAIARGLFNRKPKESHD